MLPFQLAIKGADPGALMTSYNKVNGVHASESPHLLRDIVRNEWGFEGCIISDWLVLIPPLHASIASLLCPHDPTPRQVRHLQRR